MATRTTATLPAHNAAQRGLTQADVNALMHTAQAAWENAPPRRRHVSFLWRKRRYRVHSTLFRLIVHTADGLPVACHYH